VASVNVIVIEALAALAAKAAVIAIVAATAIVEARPDHRVQPDL
jgi:hypothetical protein